MAESSMARGKASSMDTRLVTRRKKCWSRRRAPCFSTARQPSSSSAAAAHQNSAHTSLAYKDAVPASMTPFISEPLAGKPAPRSSVATAGPYLIKRSPRCWIGMALTLVHRALNQRSHSGYMSSWSSVKHSNWVRGGRRARTPVKARSCGHMLASIAESQ